MQTADNDWRDFSEALLRSAAGTFWERLGCRLEQVSGGRAVIAIDAQAWHANHLGMLHGGVHASLLDQAMGIAAFTVRPGEKMVTIHLTVHFLKPPAAGVVQAAGEVLHQTRHIVTATGRITDASGSLCAIGTASYRVLGGGQGGEHS